MGDSRQRVIRASEIGQYLYCAHAWWLGAIEGHPSRNQRALAAGDAFHHRHGAQIQATQRIRRFAYLLLGCALIIGLVGMWRLLGR